MNIIKNIWKSFALHYLIDFITNDNDAHHIVSKKGLKMLNDYPADMIARNKGVDE